MIPAGEKVLGRESVLMLISCDAKMTRPHRQFDYLRGNGTGEIRVVGFSP
jgi:hypothetical protein